MKLNDDTTINREISWLSFNERVLQEAIDPSNPLLERLRFLGIFSNNRDEFFKVRVATIKRLIKLNEKKNPLEAEKFKKILQDIYAMVERQEEAYTHAFMSLKDAFRGNKIYFLDETELNEEQGAYVRAYFAEVVRPTIFPILLDRFAAGERLKDRAIYLAVRMQHSGEKLKEKHALIEIPSDVLPRFVVLPARGDENNIIFLEDVIRYNLDEVFSILGYDRFEGYIIKFTRDSELDIDNDVSKSFLELMSESVKKRKKGLPVRFIYDKNIPEHMLRRLLKKLGVTTSYDQLRGGGRYHNFKDFMNFPDLGKDFVFPPQPPMPHPDLRGDKSIFEVLSKKDVLLHYPYQSFGGVIDFLREASIDPQVRSIKMTFYRAAKKSLVMNALINAARNGKSVTVFIELQARFDEEANIYWAQELQQEGIKVLPTIPGLKVHAKLISIRRKEDGKNQYYSLVSTGNFNESTAQVYSDLSLLTKKPEIAHDIRSVFSLLESKYLPPKFSSLVVSPFGLRNFFIQRIYREIRNKRQGKKAWIVIKANSIADNDLVNKLYEASREGVKIYLNIRGINILKSGVKGLSEHVDARSIVGRYLEHARIFVFANSGQPDYYIGSADLMTRNLDHRFEVLCPIHDKKLQKTLKDILDIQFRDNVKARSLNYNELNEYIVNDEPPINSHEETYRYYKKLSE